MAYLAIQTPKMLRGLVHTNVVYEFPAECETLFIRSTCFGVLIMPFGNISQVGQGFCHCPPNHLSLSLHVQAMVSTTSCTSSFVPYEITSGPDANLWFTEWGGPKIGRITRNGVITEFPIPTAGSDPAGITAGPGGNLWFTEFSTYKIGSITTAGVFKYQIIQDVVLTPTHLLQQIGKSGMPLQKEAE